MKFRVIWSGRGGVFIDEEFDTIELARAKVAKDVVPHIEDGDSLMIEEA